jgi:hypothetical protein
LAGELVFPFSLGSLPFPVEEGAGRSEWAVELARKLVSPTPLPPPVTG